MPGPLRRFTELVVIVAVQGTVAGAVLLTTCGCGWGSRAKLSLGVVLTAAVILCASWLAVRLT